MRAAHLDSVPMEWMLQVVDEIDDMIGAVRHRWFGLAVRTGALAGALVGALGGFRKATILRERQIH